MSRPNVPVNPFVAATARLERHSHAQSLGPPLSHGNTATAPATRAVGPRFGFDEDLSPPPAQAYR